ncbi:MAG: hypothetical protein EKK40_11780 [Bradyrhizobiaceae bacterium]|nr:MAG: hypothetical protein EKK40_11780 [Bradyrhizobiaceae bacterium]
MHTWNPIYVLPNLLIKEPIENEYVAIVAPDDARCLEIGKRTDKFIPFLSSFTDAFQHPVKPSVLLTRADAPAWVMSLDAITSFRDSISIAAVTNSRSLTMLYSKVQTYQYSTFFDFYAWTFSKDFDVLTTNNPSLWGMERFQDFKGQSTPGLAISQWEALEVDEILLKALLGEWRRRFSSTKPTWRSLALFRSLNMANAAAQLPGVVDVTPQSLGRSISLWVSAFEILAHPGDRDSGLNEVYRVFDKVGWLTEACTEEIYNCYERRKPKQSSRQRNLASWIYGQLYHARNDYLHGNPISDSRLIVESGRSLFMYTPSLYRLLLTGFLSIEFYGPFNNRNPGQAWYDDRTGMLRYRFQKMQRNHENALATILKPAT